MRNPSQNGPRGRPAVRATHPSHTARTLYIVYAMHAPRCAETDNIPHIRNCHPPVFGLYYLRGPFAIGLLHTAFLGFFAAFRSALRFATASRIVA